MNRASSPTGRLNVKDTDRERDLQQARLHGVDYQTALDLIRLSELEKETESLLPLLLALFQALNEGSLCLELHETELDERLRSFRDLTGSAICGAEILKNLDEKKWKGLIGWEPRDYLPLRIYNRQGRRFLYFQRYDAKESTLQADFQKVLSAPDDPFLRAEMKTVLVETLEENPIRRGSVPLELNRQQKIAVVLSLFKKLLIISGGPGTGKTSIVVALLRALVRLGTSVDRIRLAAPTGRAANRMSESIRMALSSIANPSEEDRALNGIEGSTLHRLLRYRGGTHPFWYHRYNPIPADLVIVDEVSMVDICLMADLVSAIQPGTRLILLGDKDQLPSVEAGAVLGNLIPGLTQTCLSDTGSSLVRDLLEISEDLSSPRNGGPMADHVVLLDTSFRSEKTILALAKQINSGSLSALETLEKHPLVAHRKDGEIEIDWPDSEGGVRWIDSAGTDFRTFEGLLDSWIDHQFLRSEEGVRRFIGLVKKPLPPVIEREDRENHTRLESLFTWIHRSRILCLVRNGPFGVEWINHHVSNRMRRETSPSRRGDLYPGLPILILQNNPSLGIFNGDVGVLLPVGGRTLRAFFPAGETYVSHPISSLPHFEHAYAITVHKSQGSEYDQILMIFPEDSENRLLSREIFYTGLTRAKTLAVLYGRQDCLRIAIERKVERTSARDLWGAEESGVPSSPDPLDKIRYTGY